MLANHLPFRSQTQQITHPGVSEIIIPEAHGASLDLVMPMLAHLSHKAGARWMSWIGESNVPQTAFDEYQFERGNVRLIHSHNDEESLWMLWDALNNGTSAFVVASFTSSKYVQKNEIAKLEQACYQGNSRALVLKHH